jgi:hypothetical protein
MTRYRLSSLLFVLASATVLATACGGDDDGTTGTGGKAGSGGSGGSVTGGSGGVGGTGGTGGTAGKDGGSKDVATPIPCGESSCNPNGTNRYCNPSGPNGPRCQACLTDMHCATNMQNPPRLLCDVSGSGACRTCLTDANCMPPNRCIMGNNNNTCVLRCTSDADCATQTTNRACNVTTMMCVECQNNTHCVGNAGGPVCAGDQCEVCGVDADCTTPGLPICDTAGTNACVQCRDNAQCAEPTPICVTTGANTCRECGANADCTGRPGGGACVMNVCRQCNGQVPCPAGNTCTMNTCVPVPEAGPPEAGREGGSDVTEGGADGADTGADAPADGTADATGG